MTPLYYYYLHYYSNFTAVVTERDYSITISTSDLYNAEIFFFINMETFNFLIGNYHKCLELDLSASFEYLCYVSTAIINI